MENQNQLQMMTYRSSKVGSAFTYSIEGYFRINLFRLKRLKNMNIKYVDERIIIVTMRSYERITNIIAIYASNTGRGNLERESFCENLQKQIIIMRYINGRIGYVEISFWSCTTTLCYLEQ